VTRAGRSVDIWDSQAPRSLAPQQNHVEPRSASNVHTQTLQFFYQSREPEKCRVYALVDLDLRLMPSYV
jgi:hypothetical protein